MDAYTFSRLLAQQYHIPVAFAQSKLQDIQDDMVEFCKQVYGNETSDAVNSNLNKYDYYFIWFIMTMVSRLHKELCFEITILFWFCVEILDNEYSTEVLMDNMKIDREAGEWLIDNIMDVSDIRASVMKLFIHFGDKLFTETKFLYENKLKNTIEEVGVVHQDYIKNDSCP